MSWSLQVTNAEADELADKLAEALADAQAQQGNGLYENDDAAEQVEAAIEAAVQLVESGGIGLFSRKHAPTGRVFTVSLSGHANPNHEPADGMANDTITVTVVQGHRS